MLGARIWSPLKPCFTSRRVDVRRTRLAALLGMCALAGSTPLAGQGAAPAAFARRVVTVAVDVGAAGREYRVAMTGGVTLVGAAAGTSAGRTVFVSVHLPAGLHAGRRTVAHVIVARDTLPVVVDVPEVRRLVLRTTGRPMAMRWGARDSVVAWLVNAGNVPESASLVVRAGPNVRAESIPRADVAPGDSARVVVRVVSSGGAPAGGLTLVARAGALQAGATVRYTTSEMRTGTPVELQVLGGTDRPRWSARVEHVVRDSIRVRLDVGDRAPAGLGRILGGNDPRALSVSAPGWGLSAGEVHYSSSVLEPSLNGVGMMARWGRSHGWLIQGAAVAGGVEGSGGAVAAGSWYGTTRVELGFASGGLAGSPGERFSVIRVGTQVGPPGNGFRWGADAGLAQIGGRYLGVGRLNGELAAGPLRAQAAVMRTPVVGFGAGSVTETATAAARLDAGNLQVFARARVSAADGAGWAAGGLTRGLLIRRDATGGLRVQRGRGSLEVLAGLRRSEGPAAYSNWAAGVGGVSLQVPLSRAVRLGAVHDHTWTFSGSERPDETRVKLDWSLPAGVVWLQGASATRGLGWQLSGGADVQQDRIGLSVSGSLLAPSGGRPRGAASGEASWRIRGNTLLLGLREQPWGNAGPEVYVGVRLRVGVALPTLRADTGSVLARSGSLVIHVAFTVHREGALELVPRGSVRLRLPAGGEVSVPLLGNGTATARKPAAGSLRDLACRPSRRFTACRVQGPRPRRDGGTPSVGFDRGGVRVSGNASGPARAESAPRR
jgi:hypothetical protein